MNSKINANTKQRRRLGRNRSVTPTTTGMKRHTSGASSTSLKQQKKQDLIKRKRKLAAAKRWENIQNLAALHQHRTKIALDTERIARGGGQYVEDAPSPSTSLPSVPHEWPFSHVTHDMGAQIELSKQLTTFYSHSSGPIQDRKSPASPSCPTQIEFTSSSSLAAAHALSNSCPNLVTPSSRFGPSTTKIGLLCSVSHKSRGGKLQGFDDHTDALLRSSSLVTNLLDSQAARSFYEQHKESWKQSEGSGVHDSSMLYAPGVAVFRRDDMEEEVVKEEGADTDDDEFELIISAEPDANLADNRSPPRTREAQGKFISPYVINVLSAVPVSASVVHKKRFTLPEERPVVDAEIRNLMQERMARCLRVFEQRGDRAIVLGAFGCGCSSQNSVDMVAQLWAELVACKGARFKDVFERIVFAVSGKQYTLFKRAFEMRLFEEEVDLALGSGDMDAD